MPVQHTHDDLHESREKWEDSQLERRGRHWDWSSTVLSSGVHLPWNTKTGPLTQWLTELLLTQCHAQLPHSHWLPQLPQSLASTTSTQSLASTTSTVTGLYNFHTVTGLYNFHTVTGLHNFHSHWLITQLPHSHWPLACRLTTYSLAYCTTATYLQAVYDCIFTALLYIYYVLTDCSTTTYSLTSTMTTTYSLACTAVKHRAIAATRPAPNRNRASLKCHWTTSWISLMSVKNFTDIFNVSEELHRYL